MLCKIDSPPAAKINYSAPKIECNIPAAQPGNKTYVMAFTRCISHGALPEEVAT